MLRLILLILFFGIGMNTPPAQAETPAAPPTSPHRTFVIVQGAWNGGWAYRGIESLLRRAGQEVYRPTLTGLGERVHLASASINLSTHVTDVVNTILFADLHDVVLVGHSYGGMVITGVANRIPERISRLL
jgi:pimeloyl-ACP methyl ester carboxylesterase